MPEVCHDYNGFQWSLNAWKILERNYSSSKVKTFTCPTVFLLTFYHNFISFFFFQINNSHDPSSMTELFLVGSWRRFIMSWNTEPEQRTTESLTLSSSKKPENYRVFFLPNSRAALAKTAGFMVETVLQKCKKIDAHNVSYCIYDSSKMLKNKVQDIFNQSLSLFLNLDVWLLGAYLSTLPRVLQIASFPETETGLKLFQKSQFLVHWEQKSRFTYLYLIYHFVVYLIYNWFSINTVD